MSEQSNID